MRPQSIPRLEPPRPRLSAGVIPYRISATGDCEIFWVRRSKSLRFMGGWNAFPGGRLSERDADLPVSGRLDGHAAYLASGKRAAHVGCALRELFEEAGILPAVGTGPAAAEIERARDALLADGLDFARWLRRHGLALDASGLGYAGRWVTPPLSHIRFDATFFLLEWPADRPRQPSVIPGELAAGEWVAAGEALARWEGGDVFLAQPTLETIRVLAEEGPAGRTRLWKSQAREPDSPHSIEFRPLTRVIPLASRTLPPATHTNALLLGGEDIVLVDPGSPWEGELRRLIRIIDSEARRTGGRLVGIWLTHQHDDHVAGAEAIRRRYDVPIHCHSATAAQLRDEGIRIEGRLEDGQAVDLPGRPPLRIRVVHTPGHSSGHLCFFEERTRTLLCGDMLSGYSTVVINPPDGSMTEYIESLDKLTALRPQVILPSHGTMFPEAGKALNAARQHRLRREDSVLAAWRDGERDPESMLAKVYDEPELHPAARPVAVRQILAHLERLESDGRIDRLPQGVRDLIGRR